MRKYSGRSITFVSVLVAGYLLSSGFVQAKSGLSEEELQSLINQNRDLQKLNQQIQLKSSAISDLDQKIDVYSQAIDKKQSEELNLENQIAVIENDLDRTENQIEKTQLELDKLNLELQGLNVRITQTQNDIGVTKSRVGETLRLLYESEQKSSIEITLSVSTLSDFFSQLTYQKTLQSSLQHDLDQLQQLNVQLDEEKGETTVKQKEVSQAEQQLEAEKQSLEGEREYKDNLLEEVAEDEEKFQALVKEAQAEQTRVNAEIGSLESSAQAKIDELREQAQSKRNNGEPLTDDEESLLVGSILFSWPVDSQEITCGFHCGGYPFAKWFQHSGIDIRTSQGTPVKAAASGYVGIAKSDGTPALAYVTIEHGTSDAGNEYSTVYMHLSSVSVSPGQFVHRGEVIGLSGGLPGTPGAGSFSTGAHLHFEVRINGIPNDPLPFLP